MKTVSPMWKNFYQEMGEIDPKRPLDNPVVRKTMGPQFYQRQAIEIVSIFPLFSTVLEVGCGFGGLAREILSSDMTISYTAVDNLPMLKQAEKILHGTVEYVPAVEVEDLARKEFDLFIANNCLTETPREYAEFVLRRIASLCTFVYIIDDLGSLESYLFNHHFCLQRVYRERNPRRFRYIGVREEEVLGLLRNL